MIIELIVKWAVPFICGSVIAGLSAVVKSIISKNKALEEALGAKNKAIEDGLQCLLRSEIIRAHDKYVTNGYCPIYAKEALKRGYEAYHNLGGNDIATKLYHDTMELPEDEANSRNI